MDITEETLDVILDALAQQLRALADQQEIVVIGGSALTALGLVKRVTKDVDLLAIAEDGELRSAEPLYAMVDQAGGRHEADLRALHPSRQELIAAARWSMTHDPSPGYKMVLKEALSALGVEDVALGP